MFTVHILSQFVACPRLPHLKAAHHLLRYLKSHPGQGIFSLPHILFKLRPFPTQIGVHAWILANLLQDIVFSLGIL